MKSTFGNNIIVSLFGESHGDNLGVTCHGLPSGVKIDHNIIKSELSRRRPQTENETSRIEQDDYEIISGVFNGYTTGAPLTIIIKNNDVNSSNYEDGVIRPVNSDYPSYVRSDGFNYYRGGGHFSGRLTAPIVALGAILKQILKSHNININASANIEEYHDSDSYGFSAQVVVKGMPVGVGEPFFDSIESILSHLIFAIPSVKGVSFGDTDISKKRGSMVKDELRYKDGKVYILSNHNGGINGGLSNGNDIVANVSFKPISSILSLQKSINMKTKENIDLIISGRHDQSIARRVPVILESIVAIGVLDLLISYLGSNALK